MNKIDKEIEGLATRMVKSTVDSKQLLFDTIMNLGPEGLKKASANLSPEEMELLKSSLEEMKKAATTPKEADDAKKLAAEQTKTKNAKMKTESLSGSDDQDEKLMEDKNSDIKHQGGPKDSPLEGQIIKGREVGAEHQTASGAVIIGHTSTGKPMYSNAEHPAHVEHKPEDHKEHAEKHESLARDIRSRLEPGKASHKEMYGQARNHEDQAMEHRKMGAKKEDAEMAKCYGGGMMKSLRKSIKTERKLVKGLFNDHLKCADSKDMPEATKASVTQDIEWKLRCLKDLRDQSWLIEQEAPEAKEIFEKKFSKVKAEIRALCEKHGSLKKSFAEVEANAKKEGADDPKAVAAAVGFKTLGKKEMERRAEAGKEKAMKKGNEEMTPEQKLEKKEMKKAKKVEKSLKKIVKLAKSLKMTKEQVVKSIKDSNNNLKLVKAEMKLRLAKGEGMDSFKPNSEVDQVKPASQDKAAPGDKTEKIATDEGDLKIKAEETADEALAKLPGAVKKSVDWKMKNTLAAGTLGRNVHYDAGSLLEKSEKERAETLARGGTYLNEREVQELRKAQDADKKLDINDMLEKGMDYDSAKIARIQSNAKSKPEGNIRMQKSFSDEEIRLALGMDKKTYLELMGSSED